jgi:hypothetical protein
LLFLPKNQYKILTNNHFAFNSVIVPDPGSPGLQVSGAGNAGIGIFLPEGQDLPEGRQMLTNMMAALKFDLEKDTRILVCPADGHSVHLPSLIQQFHLKNLLFFGVDPTTLGIRFPLPLHIAVAHQGTVYLLTHSLSDLLAEKAQDGKAMRGSLWNCLKQIFV